MKNSLLLTSALATSLMVGGIAYAQDSEQPAPAEGDAPAEEVAPAMDSPEMEGDAADAPDMQQDEPAAATEMEMEDEGDDAAEDMAESEPSETDPAGGGFLTTQDDQEYRAANVIGVSVMNIQDEEIGEVADIILDADDKVVGVVVSVGGFLGIGDKWVGVPIEQVTFETEEEIARAQYTEEQLENAPDFNTKEDQEMEEQVEQSRGELNEPAGADGALPAPGTEETPQQ